jgi:hypothetical protein
VATLDDVAMMMWHGGYHLGREAEKFGNGLELGFEPRSSEWRFCPLASELHLHDLAEID